MNHTRRPLFHLAVVEGCAVRAACGNSDPGCGWTPTLRAVTCEACLARMPLARFAEARAMRSRAARPQLAAVG